VVKKVPKNYEWSLGKDSPTISIILCWNTSLSVTIHLFKFAALPFLNVELTNFGLPASKSLLLTRGMDRESVPTDVSRILARQTMQAREAYALF